MATISTLFITDIIDNHSKEYKSAEAITKEGDWLFLQIGNYTLASPLVVNAGNTSKITFQSNDIVFFDGNGLDLNYDFTNQKFLPQTLKDVFLVEIRFKCKSSASNGRGDIKLECPTVAYNPIQAQSFLAAFASNEEQFMSIAVPIFIGQDLIDNGLEVKWTSGNGNFSIYDVSFMLVRLSSGK